MYYNRVWRFNLLIKSFMKIRSKTNNGEMELDDFFFKKKCRN